MQNKFTKYLYFTAGMLSIITSIIYFSSNKILFGITYISLAIAFIALGFAYRKRDKKSKTLRIK